MTLRMIGSDPIAPLRRLGAVAIVSFAFLAVPLLTVDADDASQSELRDLTSDVVSDVVPASAVRSSADINMAPADVSRRIEQAWRIETLQRRNGLQIAQSAF